MLNLPEIKDLGSKSQRKLQEIILEWDATEKERTQKIEEIFSNIDITEEKLRKIKSASSQDVDAYYISKIEAVILEKSYSFGSDM